MARCTGKAVHLARQGNAGSVRMAQQRVAVMTARR